jgi:hypothetical protein
MSNHEPLAGNHKAIWLEPLCCVDERSWCKDPQPCDDCGLPAIKYIRADLAAFDPKKLSDGELILCLEEMRSRDASSHALTDATQGEGRVPEGWQLVPKEPTEGMLNKGAYPQVHSTRKNLWRAMLSAAPPAPAPEGEWREAALRIADDYVAEIEAALEVADIADLLVALWQNQKIAGLPRTDRNASIAVDEWRKIKKENPL